MSVNSKFLLSTLTVLAFFVGDSVAQELVFSIDSGMTLTDSAEVEIGETLSIDFFVRDVQGSTTLADEGLIGFGLNVMHTEGFGDISSDTPNTTDFEVSNVDEDTANGFRWEFFTAGDGVAASRILLGSLDFNVTAAGTTEFTFADLTPGSEFGQASWFTPGLSFLDNDIFGPDATDTFNFTITAIPEPAYLGLVGLMFAAGFIRRSRASQ